MLRSIPLFALGLVACGGGYQADSFRTGAIWGDQKFEGTRLSHGCLDIALRAQESLDGDPTLDVSIGNRCVEARVVNLGDLRILGYFDNHAPRRLSLFDPNDEIRSALLGGRAAGHERLEVAGAHGAYQLCISVEGILPSKHGGPPTEACVLVEAGDEVLDS